MRGSIDDCVRLGNWWEAITSDGNADQMQDGAGAGGGVDSGLEDVVEGEGVVRVGARHVDVEAVARGRG